MTEMGTTEPESQEAFQSYLNGIHGQIRALWGADTSEPGDEGDSGEDDEDDEDESDDDEEDEEDADDDEEEEAGTR